jgi:hypothetical protein
MAWSRHLTHQVAARPVALFAREIAELLAYAAAAVGVDVALVAARGAAKLAVVTPAARIRALAMPVLAAVCIACALGVETSDPLVGIACAAFAHSAVGVVTTAIVLAVCGGDGLQAVAAGRSAAIDIRLACVVERWIVAGRLQGLALSRRVALRFVGIQPEARAVEHPPGGAVRPVPPPGPYGPYLFMRANG